MAWVDAEIFCSGTVHTYHHPHAHARPQALWDPSSFNFYKASPLEFVLSYTPSFRHTRDQAAALKADVIPMELGAAAGAAAAAAAAEEAKAATLGALRGAVGELHSGVPAAEGAGSDWASSWLGCAEVSTASPPQDAVLVNIRPVGAVSLLLTPGCVASEKRRCIYLHIMYVVFAILHVFFAVSKRRADFHRKVVHKYFGFSCGRTESESDDPMPIHRCGLVVFLLGSAFGSRVTRLLVCYW